MSNDLRSVLKTHENQSRSTYASPDSMKISKKILWVIFSIIVFLIASFFHTYRRPSDYALESLFRSKFSQKESVQLSQHFNDADMVCIFPYYATGRGMKLPMTAAETDKLNLYLDTLLDLINVGDHVWWLVSVRDSKLQKIYRMGQRLRPDFNEGTCIDVNGSRLVTQNFENFFYFSIERGE
jgi:uncharacterized protein YxeA